MKIELKVIGKTSFDYLKEGISIYEKRLQHYCNFNFIVIPDIKNAKNLRESDIKKKEGEAVLKKLDKNDFLVLLDENGKKYSSLRFAEFIEKKTMDSGKKIVFLIGGAYGFSEEIYQRANQKISLSDMTFSHQMVRLFFIEQLYRAYTIINNEPYHHQ